MRNVISFIKRRFLRKGGFSLLDAIAGVALMVIISAVVLPILSRGVGFVGESSVMRNSSYNAASAISTAEAEYKNAEYTTENDVDYKIGYWIDFSGSTPTMEKYSSTNGTRERIEESIDDSSNQNYVTITTTDDGLIVYYAPREK